jgi:transposase-like protein
MTEERVILAELLEKAGDGDLLRAVAEAVLQLLMESDVEGLIDGGYERSRERITWRNGYRDRTLDTRLGALQLRIPKLRQSLPSRKRGAATSRRSWKRAKARRRHWSRSSRRPGSAVYRPGGWMIWCRRWG